MSDQDRCGTNAGYQAHRRAGEAACVLCKSARAAYMKRHREDATVKRRNAEVRDARMAALKELGHLYPEEYQRLYRESLAVMRGIDLGRTA